MRSLPIVAALTLLSTVAFAQNMDTSNAGNPDRPGTNMNNGRTTTGNGMMHRKMTRHERMMHKKMMRKKMDNM